MLKIIRLLVLSPILLAAFSVYAAAEKLPAGTTIEVRLSGATGSRISHPGDRVQAVVIAPVFRDGRLCIPQGATALGVVESVQRLGLGLRHRTAGIQYRFDTVRLPDGEMIPVNTRLVEVETAKERVHADGKVGGIYPTANLSSSVSAYALSFLYLAPATAVPALAIKFLIARSPDPEIYFPAGTEMILQLTAAAYTNGLNDNPSGVGSVSAEEIVGARKLLNTSPEPVTAREAGRPSDLINILFLGSRKQLDRAFYAAGWTGPQRRSALSLYRMYHSTVERMGYSTAPMGKLTLNGKYADAAYEKSLDTFSKRHHLRLWQQQQPNLWLSAATEDVGYKFQSMHLTHATDPRIDNERAKVVNDLTLTGCLEAASLLRGSSVVGTSVTSNSSSTAEKPVRPAVTDGMIAVLRLNDCRNPRTVAGVPVDLGRPRHARFVRGLIALGNDVVRSNILFLGFNTMKLFNRTEQRPSAADNRTAASQQPQLGSPELVQGTWVRGSVLNISSGGR